MNRLMNHLKGKNKNKKKKRSVLKNGGILLEELMVSFDGKANPICCFSSNQILKATDNFSYNRYISRGFGFIWYKGVIEDRPVLIKKWPFKQFPHLTEACRDISVSSQMSGHKNSLKLIGCCLEFDVPALICEYTEHGPLNWEGKISNGEVLPWKIRLKISKEIASVVTFLHTAFPETIIHRFINPTNIFIDRNWTAKLSDFGLCVAIPDGEQYVIELVEGARGFIEPEYNCTRKVTEKVDIYCFGVVMLVLLSGKPALYYEPDKTPPFRLIYHVCEVMENGDFEEIVDKEIWNAPCDDLVSRRSQFESFFGLALRCIRFKRAKPVSSMIEVAKELKLIEKLS